MPHINAIDALSSEDSCSRSHMKVLNTFTLIAMVNSALIHRDLKSMAIMLKDRALEFMLKVLLIVVFIDFIHFKKADSMDLFNLKHPHDDNEAPAEAKLDFTRQAEIREHEEEINHLWYQQLMSSFDELNENAFK